MSEEADGPWIEFRLPEPLGKQSFKTSDDFGKWLQDEETFIEHHLSEVASISGVGDGHWKRVTQRMTGIKEAFQHAKGDTSMLSPLRRQLEDGFGQDIPPSRSRFGLFVQDAKKRYNKDVAREAASYMLLQYQGHQRPGPYMSGLGVFLARLWEEHVPCRADLELGTNTYAKWSNELDAARRTLKAWEEEAHHTLAEKRANLEKLEKEYVEQRSLKEPADYWHNKMWWHRLTSWALFGAFILVGLGGGALLIYASYSIRKTILDIQNPNVWQFVSNSFPVLIGLVGLFWLLRILARVYFQQVHLWSDANERVVLIRTYLSLLVGSGVLEGKAGVHPEHLTILFSQISRAGKQGGVDQDAAPPILAKYVTEKD